MTEKVEKNKEQNAQETHSSGAKQ